MAEVKLIYEFRRFRPKILAIIGRQLIHLHDDERRFAIQRVEFFQLGSFLFASDQVKYVKKPIGGTGAEVRMRDGETVIIHGVSSEAFQGFLTVMRDCNTRHHQVKLETEQLPARKPQYARVS